RKAREEAERKAQEEKEREESARKAREDAARKAREEAERKAAEERKRKAREDEKQLTPEPPLILWHPKLFFSICAIVCFALLLSVVYHLLLGHAGGKWVALKGGTTDNLYSIAGSGNGRILYTCGAGKSFLNST